MEQRLISILTGGCLLALGAQAHALTVVEELENGPGYTDYFTTSHLLMEMDGFNEALGTLTGVSLQVGAYMRNEATLLSGDGVTLYSLGYEEWMGFDLLDDGSEDLSVHNLVENVISPPEVVAANQIIEDIDSFSGTDFGGAPYYRDLDWAAAGATLNDFKSPWNLDCTYSIEDRSDIRPNVPGGDFDFVPDTITYCNVRAVYTYDPAPIPATFLLMASGLFALRLRRRA